MTKLTNAGKVIRSRKYTNCPAISQLRVMKGLNRLDDLREFFQKNEINNPDIWDMINQVELALVGNEFE